MIRMKKGAGIAKNMAVAGALYYLRKMVEGLNPSP